MFFEKRKSDDCGHCRVTILFTLYVFVCVYWCFVFRHPVYTMLPLSLDCPFLMALQYSLTFISLLKTERNTIVYKIYDMYKMHMNVQYTY
jgi:hypothetical protein